MIKGKLNGFKRYSIMQEKFNHVRQDMQFEKQTVRNVAVNIILVSLISC